MDVPTVPTTSDGGPVLANVCGSVTPPEVSLGAVTVVVAERCVQVSPVALL